MSAPTTNAPLLFLGHAADRTGPPIYLRHFLRWLRAEKPEVDFEVALLLGGELLDDFRDLAPTSTCPELPPMPWSDDELAEVEQLRRVQMAQHAGCEVVHINGAPCAELARLLPPGERVLLSHVHELEIGLSHWLPEVDRQLLLGDAAQIFVPAKAVERNLVVNHGVDPGIVAHHPEMVDVREAPPRLDPHERALARAARGLPSDGYVVAMSGTVYWRKAFDIFLRLAWEVRDRHGDVPVTFLWLGGEPGAIGHAERMARVIGVSEIVRFVPTRPDPLEWFQLVDLFALTAREDPFPLVCLEAASLGVPTVAFDTGGMPELLDQGCGVVVPYPDVGAMAGAVADLLTDGERRAALSYRCRELMRDRYDVSYLAPRLWADIERWLP